MHLGNEKFNPDDEGVTIQNTSVVKIIACQLGCKTEILQEALTTRTVSIAGATRRGSVYSICLKPHEAINDRDALAKALYGMCLELHHNLMGTCPHQYCLSFAVQSQADVSTGS